MLLASTALHKGGGLWDPLVKGCVEQWPDPADPTGVCGIPAERLGRRR